MMPDSRRHDSSERGRLARLGRVGAAEPSSISPSRRPAPPATGAASLRLSAAPDRRPLGAEPGRRAGGRCLDVLRLSRITTDSPAVEATSVRCQACSRRCAAASTRPDRCSTRHARPASNSASITAFSRPNLFAGFVEFLADDPAAAEPHLRLPTTDSDDSGSAPTPATPAHSSLGHCSCRDASTRPTTRRRQRCARRPEPPDRHRRPLRTGRDPHRPRRDRPGTRPGR